MNIDPTGRPMMSDADIDAIERLFVRQRPARILEWGGGNSTIAFSKFPCVVAWTTVEHDGHYVQHLRPRTDPYRVHLVWAPEDQWYIDCVKHNVRAYDLILVDGLDHLREKCVAAGLTMLAPGGVLLLHDSQRPEYQAWLQQYPNREQLTEGEVPVPGGFAHRGLTLFRTP